MTKITRLNILRLGVVWFELNYQYFLSISFCPSLVSHLAASFSHSSPLRPSLSTIMYLVSERQTIMYFEPEKAIRSRGCPGSTADGGLTLMTYVRLQRLNWLTSSVLSKTRLSIYNSNKDTFILIAHVLFTHTDLSVDKSGAAWKFTFFSPTFWWMMNQCGHRWQPTTHSPGTPTSHTCYLLHSPSL